MNIKVVYLCLTVAGGTTVQRGEQGDAYENPPCLVNDFASPIDNVVDCGHWKDHISNIKDQLRRMKSKSKRLLRSMANGHCYNIENEASSFMNITVTNLLEERGFLPQNLCNSVDSLLVKMREHYDLLNKLANYFERLRVTSHDDSSRGIMESFQTKVYDCMCRIKMALRAGEQDPIVNVPSGTLSPIFVQYINGSVCHHQKAQYYFMHYGHEIAKYLKTIYRRAITIR